MGLQEGGSLLRDHDAGRSRLGSSSLDGAQLVAWG